MPASQLPPMVAALLDPQAYPEPPAQVELVQTHVSWVLLAGEHVYKLKKPVRLGFLDYGTLERRHAMCEAEVALNRRLCDGVYLGVEPVTLETGRYRIGGRGAAVEWAVHMRRVPADRMLPALLARGEAGPETIAAIARKLAAFHRASAPGPDVARFGGVETVALNWRENLEQLRPHIGRTVEAATHDALSRYGERFLAEEAPLLEARAAAGCVRDCHGDLRADAVAVGTDDAICIMDCIEFNVRLRYCDVSSEVAFLAMDLEDRGHGGAGEELAACYCEDSGDETFALPFDFYRSYRALVRAKVTSMLAVDAGVDAAEQQAAAAHASRLCALALRYARRAHPRAMILMHGLSGTGKSYVANAVALRLGAAIVHSDVVRRQLMPAAARARYGEGAYRTEARQRVYDELHRRAETYLRDGRGVVVDATYLGAAERAAAIKVAEGCDAPWLIVETAAPETVVRERLRARGEGAASQAAWDTYLAQRRHAEPLDDATAASRIAVDADMPLGARVDAVEAALEALAARRG
jgi:aminoglycoside phosphotransferase family enzyme/predicted kinase